MDKPIKIGLLGLGNVGSATVNVLLNNAQEITRRAGRNIVISHACVRDINRSRDCDLSQVNVGTDPLAIVENPDIDIVIELMGGTDPAKDLLLKAMENGKHIVTANKALIALHGNEIFAAAQKTRINVAFEAAVAGGIPIIKAIREGLAANHILDIAGIINGTSNYILTEMMDKGRDFEDVLAQAQQLGYAEADPSFDIEGVDVAHKLTILSSIAFGIPLQFDKVYLEGISHVTALDAAYAKELGYRLKHLGITRKTDKGIELRVHPTLIQNQHLLANVNGVMNAIRVNGDTVGPTIYYGAGAGGNATASAVIADLIDVIRVMTVDPENRVPHLAFQADSMADLPIAPIESIQCANYLRFQVDDEAGVLASITQILASNNISIEAFIQKSAQHNSKQVPIVILTQTVLEGDMQNAMVAIEQLATVHGQGVRIRLQ